jgi:hypothetical protein
MNDRLARWIALLERVTAYFARDSSTLFNRDSVVVGMSNDVNGSNDVNDINPISDFMTTASSCH